MEKVMKKTGKAKRSIKIIFLSIIAILIIVPNIIIYAAFAVGGVDAFFNCNNPVIIMGLDKFDIMGKSPEEISEKYELCNVEYNENGEIAVQYYMPTDKCMQSYNAYYRTLKDMRVKILFSDNVAVDMMAVLIHEGMYLDVNEPFDDWFTRYPYLGFIY